MFYPPPTQDTLKSSELMDLDKKENRHFMLTVSLYTLVYTRYGPIPKHTVMWHH